MLYDSTRAHAEAPRTEWLRSGTPRQQASYRIYVVCRADAAQRVELLVLRGLKAKGAGVRVSAAPAASKDGSRTRMVFTVHGGGDVRGAIAGLVNLLGADSGVRTVRWESDPQAH